MINSKMRFTIEVQEWNLKDWRPSHGERRLRERDNRVDQFTRYGVVSTKQWEYGVRRRSGEIILAESNTKSNNNGLHIRSSGGHTNYIANY